jgi:hypothetical protein
MELKPGTDTLPSSKACALRQRYGRARHYALDSKVTLTYPPADLAIDHIGDLVNYPTKPRPVGGELTSHSLSPTP